MRLKKIYIKLIHYIGAVAFMVCVFGCNEVSAATVQINSNSSTMSSDGIMTLSVVLDSGGVAINNAEAKIIFPTDLLEVVSINKGGSIFSLWVEEPSYSNVTGVITFNGGIPTPGFNGSSGTALSIVVKAKSPGKADLIFQDAAIRANDGLGTDILTGKKDKTINIVKKDISVIEEPPAVVVPISAMEITSPTHPSQEFWYKDTSPLFRWKIQSGVDAVQTGIDHNTSGLPKVTYRPAIDEKIVKNLQDGIWYFKIRSSKNGKWGPVSTYITRIDSTIPKNNGVSFVYDEDKKALIINSNIIDETSGVDYYEIYINDSLTKKIPSEEFISGNYEFNFSDSYGDSRVKLVAVDHAGNSVEASGTFYVKVPEIVKVESVPEVDLRTGPLLMTLGSFSVPAVYFVIVIISSAVLLAVFSFKFGRHYGKLRGKFKVHASLVRKDNTKALMLLKRRLEKHLEILQHTRHGRILSNEEKEIKEAIEVDLDEVDKALEEQKDD